MEHARVAELERQLESARCESQDRAAEARAEGQRVAEWATITERRLEAAKACKAETEAGLRTSLAETEVALQKSLETLESERSALVSERTTLESARKALEEEQRALEVERKARLEADQEVLVLRGQVMGTEEASTRLREQVARQVGELSVLENFHVGAYFFCFLSCWFLPLACF